MADAAVATEDLELLQSAGEYTLLNKYVQAMEDILMRKGHYRHINDLEGGKLDKKLKDGSGLVPLDNLNKVILEYSYLYGINPKISLQTLRRYGNYALEVGRKNGCDERHFVQTTNF